MKRIILLALFVSVLLLAGCESAFESTEPAAIMPPDEDCLYDDGNITIQGCHAVNKYIDTKSEMMLDKASQERWRFEIECKLRSDTYDGEPWKYGEDLTLECYPKRW